MKKKGLLIIALLFFVSSTFAQQYSWYIGGQLGFGSQKSTNHISNQESKTTSYSNSPEVGFFLANDIVLGLGVNFNMTKVNNNTANTDYDRTALTSPVVYARKFFSIEDIFSAFVGLDVNYSVGKFRENRNDVLTTTDKLSGFGANLNIGIAYPLGKRFTAVGKYGLLGYESLTLKDDAGVKQRSQSDFGFNVNSLGSLFNIGLYYTFVLIN